MSGRRRAAVLAVVGALVVALLPEALLAFLLAHPAAVPAPLLEPLRRVYVREDWIPIQSDPACARYDDEVTYLLQPGECRFANREFDTTVRANRAGLRDDEASLEGPDLIVLGDSYAMGWGVEREDAFAHRLEEATGLKVLAAGMSSFGTAREMLLLRRLDRSHARAVVVQYFVNDLRENRRFVENGGALDISSPEAFAARVEAGAAARSYRPFDYLRAALDDAPLLPGTDAPPEEVAATLLAVLDAADALGDLPVLLLEVAPWGRQDDAVVAAAARLLADDPRFAALRGRVRPVFLADVLGPEDAFVLDPHLLPSGHAAIAAALEAELRAAGLLD